VYKKVLVFFDLGIPRFCQIVIDVITFGECVGLLLGLAHLMTNNPNIFLV
jgi:hypothetical protein